MHALTCTCTCTWWSMFLEHHTRYTTTYCQCLPVGTSYWSLFHISWRWSFLPIFCTGLGYYVYIETSSPRLPGEEARFMSTFTLTTYRQCLSFWYHMFGPTVETLNVYARRNDSDVGDLGSLVWSSYGEKSDKWILGSVTTAEPVPFQVSF